MTIDIGPILNVHEAQGVPKAVVDIARSLSDDLGAIDTARYQRQRADELKRERQEQAVALFVDQLHALKNVAAKQGSVDLEQHDRAEHQRVRSANRHAVDPAVIAAATKPAELSALMSDALIADADTARKMWLFVQPRLRDMAAREMREHRQPSATSAFNAFVRLEAQMRDLAHRSPDRAQLSDVIAGRQREIEQQILAVARLVGLDMAVQAAARRAAIPEKVVAERSAAGNTIIGKFWDENPHLVR